MAKGIVSVVFLSSIIVKEYQAIHVRPLKSCFLTQILSDTNLL